MGGFKALRTKDLVNVGIYSALYFICMGIAEGATTLLTGLLLPGFTSIFVPCVVGLLAGPVYMLLCRKVPRFGALTIMGVLMGLFFLVSGHFALAFIPYALCGLLADLVETVLAAADPGRRVLRDVSYVVFTFGSLGPVLPLWFMKNAYVASLLKRGKSQDYIDTLFSHISAPTLLACVALTLLGALAGALIGDRIVARHFSGQAGRG
ncbi:MptD family putative ECF transporter S component [Bifidobacterium xylocopae]|uniref:ABC transporter permease n=1 Tax=Bifidobacterium xylocopae TaxID=2493119 RepID=A0A366KDI5_9BIFI|nr:MptD family putative ECF transporter S component [Bifidobacterium xylocopae]RBP99764.1 ABC transporter permease [Bifidobacterium xylocopae]